MRFAATTALIAGALAGLTPVPVRSQGISQPFSQEMVQTLANELAHKSYEAPELPKAVKDLDYDQYRQIRFRKERTIWRGEGLNFELQFLPTGWLFKEPVEINVVEDGNVRSIGADNSYFDLAPLAGRLPPEARLGFSGFRLTGPLNRPDLFDETIVFQGASYFRALSRGQIYGLSARGLALNVGRPEGEEFPLFRRFWIEKPQPGARQIILHALLDSPSVTGAYRFKVAAGSPTTVDVQTTLYPRKDLPYAGIAPLTSMFLFSGIDRSRINDFRSAVHDSDGLAIINGWGEQLWRPLSNPRRLQTSDFLDQNPRGFGLIQRARQFSDYQDLEARYERRPSSWVEPREGWGAGAVQLFEIPSEEEIHDNIVAFWKPARPLATGKAHAFNYRLSWPDTSPRDWAGAYVRATRSGLITGPQRKSGALQFAVDFEDLPPSATSDLPLARVEATSGAVSAAVVQVNPDTSGWRVSFSFDPKGAASSELRLALFANDTAVSDTWLYRWTKD